MTHDQHIESLIREYIPSHEQDFVERIIQDETDALLYGVITELRALRTVQTGNPQNAQTVVELVQQEMQQGVETTGVYHSETFDLSEGDFDKVLDLDFVATEVDLRFTDDVQIAYADPAQDDNVIEYAKTDSPVAGTPVRTNTVHAKAQDGTGGAQLTIEAWRGQA
jgi:hypothetical protein